MKFSAPQKVNLGFFPTPLVKLSTLSSVLNGPEIFMKRDDLTGLGLGGNKTRKLEFIMHEAIEKGCNTVITAGAAQSNHCRQTAAAAAQLNLDCHLVLGGCEPQLANGNLLLDKLFGAHIHWAGKNRKGEDIPKIVQHLEAKGKRCLVIPYGGSNELGAYGFVSALQELESQIDIAQISHIVFASSSGGTHAGLMLGKAILGHSYQVVGIKIDKEDYATTTFNDMVIELANKTSRGLNLDVTFTGDDLTLNSDYIGGGYGVVGEAEKEAISITANSEGILLDPVYTARAMAALIDMIRKDYFTKTDKVLFWHTGGAPSLFAYADELT